MESIKENTEKKEEKNSITLPSIAEKPKTDWSVVEKVEKLHDEQLAGADEIEATELPRMDLRIREGADHADDVIVVEGEDVIIPQLTIMDIRKIQIRSLNALVGTPLEKKVILASRTKADKDKKLDLTPAETILMSEVGIEEDFWYAWFALREHSKFTGDMEQDREWIGRLDEYDEIVAMIRKANAIDEGGSKRVKFFRNH